MLNAAEWLDVRMDQKKVTGHRSSPVKCGGPSPPGMGSGAHWRREHSCGNTSPAVHVTEFYTDPLKSKRKLEKLNFNNIYCLMQRIKCYHYNM